LEGKLSDVVTAQFLLAEYGISIGESNQLCVFEFDAFLNLAIEKEHKKIEQLTQDASHLA
jgi:hypothetical protein